MAKRSKKTSAAGRTEESQFVFRGTVIQRGAATMDEVPLTRNATIVRVDEVLEGPPVLEGISGQEVTVQLAQGQSVSTGKSYVFQTHGWLYGAGLAVKAVKVTPATDAEMRAARRTLETAPERALRERANSAELVVTGRVTEIREVKRLPGAPITEHDPEWRRAVVAVADAPAVGRKTRARKPREVVIRFAASPDVRWARAPKFAVGDAGVWMLGERKKTAETRAVRAAAGAEKDEFVVVEPEDFLPIEFSERVRALLSK